MKTEEKDAYISKACVEYVARMLPPLEYGQIIDIDERTYMSLYSLVYETGQMNLSLKGSVGRISISAVQDRLNELSGSCEPFMGVFSVALTQNGSTVPVNWHKDDDFIHPVYILDGDNFIIYPTNAGSVSFTLLKRPAPTNLHTGTNIELPAHTHGDIVRLAAEMATNENGFNY